MAKISVNDAAQILEIPFDATYDQLRKAYKRLVLKYHPDKNQNNPHAEEMTKKINEAYIVFEEHLEKKRQENMVNSSTAHAGQNNPVVDILRQEYEKAMQKHKDFLDNELKTARQSVKNAENDLQDLIANPAGAGLLDRKIESIDKLKSLLMRQKILVGQAVLLAEYAQKCKKQYEDALAGRYYAGNTQDRR